MGILSIPVLAIVSLVQSILLKKRVDHIQSELDLLRLAPETKTSESVHARLRLVEENLDRLHGILNTGPHPAQGMEQPKELVPPVTPPTIVLAPKEIPIPPDPFAGRLPENPIPAAPVPSIEKPTTPEETKKTIDWEKFTAGKLMSWIGGFALFLGAIFFAKYSIDHGLIPPAMRVAFGLVFGAAAVLGGFKLFARYAVTGQTLAASGAAILYAVTFAAHSLYGFLGPTETFLFLSLVTVLAFLLSAHMNSQYIAILALVGGFLVPPLISTGVDRPFGLFAYVTLLDIGLLALVASKGWGFLWGWAVAGTIAMMGGWWSNFFGPEKMLTATVMTLWFPLLFAAARAWMEKRDKEDRWTLHAAGLIPVVSIVFGALSLFQQGVSQAPLPAFLILFGADLVTAWLAVRHGKTQIYHLAAGGLIFFTVLGWTQGALTPETLPLALVAYLAFGGLHGALSFVLYRRGAPKEAVILGHLFPVALLAPLTLGLLKDFAAPGLVWPVVFGPVSYTHLDVYKRQGSVRD